MQQADPELEKAIRLGMTNSTFFVPDAEHSDFSQCLKAQGKKMPVGTTSVSQSVNIY